LRTTKIAGGHAERMASPSLRRIILVLILLFTKTPEKAKNMTMA
jgi:hypothetical protein